MYILCTFNYAVPLVWIPFLILHLVKLASECWLRYHLFQKAFLDALPFAPQCGLGPLLWLTQL